MAVDEATVRRIAKLARISVSDDQAHAIEGELNTILDWVEQLNEVNVEGVEPMTSVVEMSMKMRDDEVADGECPEKVIANAPANEEHFYLVPKVVE